MAKQARKIKPKLVANMGLFWRKDAVLWRGDRRRGKHSLLGKQHGAKRQGVVNFWNQVGIYALYAEYKLVYVGQAGLGDKACIGSRLFHHTKDDLAGRWDMFSWFGFRKVNKNNALGARKKRAGASWPELSDVLEGVLIEVAEPPQNSQKGRFGPGVRRYLQDPHCEEDAPDLSREVKELARQVARVERQQQTGVKRLSSALNQVKRFAKKASKKK